MTTLAPPATRRRVGGMVIGAFAAVYIIWGSTYLFIRLAVETLPPLLMAGVRFLVAGGLLWAVAARRGQGSEPVGPRQWRAAAVVGGLLLMGGNGMVSYAEQFVPTGVVALLIATVPLFIALFGAVFLGRRLRRLAIAGIVVGLCGTALLLRPGGTTGSDFGHTVMVLVSPLSWAAGSVYATRASLPRRALVATAMEMLCGGAMLLVLGLAVGEVGQVHLDHVSVVSLLSLVYLIVFGSLVAFSAYVWLLTAVATTAVATYAYVNPLVAVILGAAFLGEQLSVSTFVAAGLIVVAVALILSRPAHAHRDPGVPISEPA